MGLTRIEFDDEVRFHLDGVRHIRKGRNAGIGRNQLVMVDFDVFRNITFCELYSFENDNQLLRLFANFNNVTGLQAVGLDVDAATVHIHVAMVDELAGSEDRRNKLGAIYDCVEARFQQTDQVFTGVALAASGFFVGLAELLFGDVAVEALELLLCAELYTEVRQLALAALAVLAWAIFTTVYRGLRTAPDVFAKTAINFVLSGLRLLIAFPSKVIAPGGAGGNAPSSALCFRGLTG